VGGVHVDVAVADHRARAGAENVDVLGDRGGLGLDVEVQLGGEDRLEDLAEAERVHERLRERAWLRRRDGEPPARGDLGQRLGHARVGRGVAQGRLRVDRPVGVDAGRHLRVVRAVPQQRREAV